MNWKILMVISTNLEPAIAYFLNEIDAKRFIDSLKFLSKLEYKLVRVEPTEAAWSWK